MRVILLSVPLIFGHGYTFKECITFGSSDGTLRPGSCEFAERIAYGRGSFDPNTYRQRAGLRRPAPENSTLRDRLAFLAWPRAKLGRENGFFQKERR
jgi:hypothetical protein